MQATYSYTPNFRDNFHGVMLGFFASRIRIVKMVVVCLAMGILAAQVALGAGLAPICAAPVAVASALAGIALLTMTLGWGDISRIRETRRVFLMYRDDQPVFAIEKSAVGSGEAIAELRSFLRAKKPLAGAAPE